MSSQSAVRFGFQVAPVGRIGAGDLALYREVVEDAKFGASLGYDSVWMLEHHFSDYYPTPSPLIFLSHIAAHCPTLSLGTAVLVLPWYQPLRLVSELSMLTLLTDRELHIGLGRGTAPMEYDAFDVNMDEARDRFVESLKLMEAALDGGKFDFHGQFYNVRRPVTLRPVPASRPNFYGAIGSPDSAGAMAALGLPPLCISNFPDRILQAIMTNWTERAQALGMSTEVTRPLYVKCFIGDTVEEARAEAKQYLPETFKLQVQHYETDSHAFGDTPGYESFAKFFENLRKLTDPNRLDPYLDFQMIGTPDTVAERLEQLIGMGFNYIIVQGASVGVPMEARRRMLQRFAEEVRPRFETRAGAPKPALIASA